MSGNNINPSPENQATPDEQKATIAVNADEISEAQTQQNLGAAMFLSENAKE
jgi:hypothetical protein